MMGGKRDRSRGGNNVASSTGVSDTSILTLEEAPGPASAPPTNGSSVRSRRGSGRASSLSAIIILVVFVDRGPRSQSSCMQSA